MRSGGPGLLMRLVAATVAAGLLVAVIGGTVQANAARDALRGEIVQRNVALADEVAARLDSRLETQANALATTTSRRGIATLDDDATQELRTIVNTSTSYDELVLFDLTGKPLAAAANAYTAQPATEDERPELATAVIDGPAFTVTTGVPPTLEVAVPVENPPGVLTGVLLGRMPLEVWAGPALRIDPKSQTTRFIATPDGQIIVHPERNRVVEGQTFPLTEAVSDPGGEATIEVDGETQLVSVADLRTLDVVAVIEQPESVALEPVSNQLRGLTLILAGVMSVIVLVVILTGAWLLRPLQPLAVGVRRLGRHERGVRVAARSPGEVGVLAGEFNRLAEVLDRRQDELDELQRLSLLVNTRTSRDEVAAEVTGGAARLLRVDQAAFCVAGDRLPEVVSAHGAIAEGAVLEQAATAVRIGRTYAGREGTMHYAALPVQTIDGRTMGVIVLARSDTEFEADEIALAETYAAFTGVALENVDRLALEQDLGAELAEAVEQRRSLMSTVSHEFRTPLTCIEGFSSMLLDGWDGYDDPQRRDLVGKVHHHSRELEDLVNRLLDFAVTERGTLEAHLQPVALHGFIGEVVDSMRPLLEGRPIDLDVADVTVSADPVMLRRALSNLLSNAAKYSSEGSPIAVRAIDDGERIRLEVVDEGVGLTADEAARAFLPFWRAGSSSTRRARGAGLGLALVAQYAQAMGGAAGVVSEPGYGSTFFLTLVPVRDSAPVSEASVE